MLAGFLDDSMSRVIAAQADALLTVGARASVCGGNRLLSRPFTSFRPQTAVVKVLQF